MSLGNNLNVQNVPLTSSVGDDGESPVENQEEEEEEEEEEEGEEEEEDAVELGMLVEMLKHDWIPCPFTSTAGGFPAWLDPINLPCGSSTICGICGDPLQFLLQVYAPLSQKESAFHRILYVFTCLSMKCLLQHQDEQRKHPSSTSVKVFRCQLPQSNQFYTSEYNRKVKDAAAALCSWCRTWKGSSVCGNCKISRYCSKKHQAAHWRKAHNAQCPNLAVDAQLMIPSSFVASNTIWPHFKIDLEVELKDDTISENDFEGVDADQKSWAAFLERVLRKPDQVLRYCRHASARPLWAKSSVRPSKTDDIPPCCYCGGPRCFELQIMPQLLYYFGVENDVNSLDWSTIVIYTCEASCDGSMAYKQEFAWIQLP